MIALLALTAALTGLPQASVAHSRSQVGNTSHRPAAHAQDALQACARKALSPGDPYHLKPWQRKGYTQALGTHRHVRLWLTQFYPSEGRDSRHTCSGAPVSLRVMAANRMPIGSYVWVAEPARLRQVLDRGSHRNDRIADRHGCYAWGDEWIPCCHWRGLDTRIVDAVLIGGSK